MEHLKLTPTAVQLLQAIQAEQIASRPNPDPILRDHDAVVATYGLGPAMYLCLDGRVLMQDEDDPAPVLTTNVFAQRATLLILIKRYQLPELLAPDLFPAKPAGASICQLCGGTRWVGWKVICHPCRALGWIAEENASS